MHHPRRPGEGRNPDSIAFPGFRLGPERRQRRFCASLPEITLRESDNISADCQPADSQPLNRIRHQAVPAHRRRPESCASALVLQ